VCDDGYFATNSAECKKCPTSGVSAQYVLTLIFIVSGAWFGWKAWLRVAERNPKLAAAITEKLPEVLKLLTGMFQILGAFTTLLYRVPWPDAFEFFSRLFALANFDLFSIPSLRCSSLASDFLSRFALHLAIDLLCTGMFIALLLYSYSKHNLDRGRPVTPSLAWNLFLPFLFLICELHARSKSDSNVHPGLTPPGAPLSVYRPFDLAFSYPGAALRYSGRGKLPAIGHGALVRDGAVLRVSQLRRVRGHCVPCRGCRFFHRSPVVQALQAAA
jgi:TRAP-type C4-dicarboxylate transport system permease small subunit